MDAQHVIADRYSLAEPLPGSVTGLSWHAVDQWSGQQVVITRVPVSGLEDAELVRVRQEIAREIRVLSGLRHDRLARPIGVVPGHGDLWVVSELAPDVTMAGELRRRGTLGPAEVARWGADVADGLVAAHGAGVVHRNLSAGVVGIAADGRAVVSGFATTVLIPRNPRAGVPAHLAPEMAWGAPPSSASDIFALGAMLYSAVEGRDPFPAGDHVLAPPQRAGLLGDLLVPMLHPDPAQRPSAMGVAGALGQLSASPSARPPSVTWSAVTPASVTYPAPGAIGLAPTQRTFGPPAGGPFTPGPGPSAQWASPQPDLLVPEQRGPGSPPGVTGPAAAPPRRKLIRWMIVAAEVVVLVLAVGLLAGYRPPWTAGLPGPPAAAPSPSPSPIGDPRTADPCGLLSVNSVRRFGAATMYRDAGYPQSCVVGFAGGGKRQAYLSATFGAAWERVPYGVSERNGELTIFRTEAYADECARTIVLADRSRVYLEAYAPPDSFLADPCALADAGTQTTVAALASGSLPRRDAGAAPHSLIGVDTCSLLDQAALRQVPGLDATRREPGFAHWLCLWGDNPAFRFTPVAKVAVDRGAPLSGQPVQIGGRSAQVIPGDAEHRGSCEVDLVQRSYVGSSGYPRVELLEITVKLGAEQATDVACSSARALAEAAARNLPPAV